MGRREWKSRIVISEWAVHESQRVGGVGHRAVRGWAASRGVEQSEGGRRREVSIVREFEGEVSIVRSIVSLDRF